MAKQGTPNADRLRQLREAKHVTRMARRTTVTISGLQEGMAEAVQCSIANAAKRKARKEAKRG